MPIINGWPCLTEDQVYCLADQTAEGKDHANGYVAIQDAKSGLQVLSPGARPGSCNKRDTVLQGQWQSIWDEDITGESCPCEEKLQLQLSQAAALKQLCLLFPDTEHKD